MTPCHLAFIMDGNRRWATERGLSVLEGYKRGKDVMLSAIDYAQKHGAKCVSVFAFSTENFSRKQSDVDAVFAVVGLFCEDILAQRESITNGFSQLSSVKIVFLGDKNSLGEKLCAYTREVEDKTANRQGLTLNIALGYGARQDILQSCQICAQSGDFSVGNFESNLSSAGMPPLDLIVRTGGEKRLSNFMLYEAAYAELFFIDKLWCDFTMDDLDKIYGEFAARKRNYGK